MSVRRSTLGALARSRTAIQCTAPKTLVPFLYQTPTIQQRKPSAARNASSYRDGDDSIPFEGAEDLPPSIERGAPDRERQTTLTGSEREAFQKLYRKAAQAEKSSHDALAFLESDRVDDELAGIERDESDDNMASLDSVFDAVLAGLPTSGKSRKYKKAPDTLKTLAESILRPEIEAGRSKSGEAAAAEAARIKQVREQDKARVQNMLLGAHTDRELWSILKVEVLDKIRALDLDGMQRTKQKQKPRVRPAPKATPDPPTTTPEQASSTPKHRFPVTPTKNAWTPAPPAPRTPDNDPRILFPNFPSHLVFATQLLRKNFPSSPLPLTILPTLKSLGRSSYALGATTSLYNLLIRTVWIQYSSYEHIDELLTDMDNGGIEFDRGTVSLLEMINAEYGNANRGRLGFCMQSIIRMDLFTEGAAKMKGWLEIAVQRLTVLAGQRRAEGAVVRKYVFQGAGGKENTERLRPVEFGARDGLMARRV